MFSEPSPSPGPGPFPCRCHPSHSSLGVHAFPRNCAPLREGGQAGGGQKATEPARGESHREAGCTQTRIASCHCADPSIPGPSVGGGGPKARKGSSRVSGGADPPRDKNPLN